MNRWLQENYLCCLWNQLHCFIFRGKHNVVGLYFSVCMHVCVKLLDLDGKSSEEQWFASQEHICMNGSLIQKTVSRAGSSNGLKGPYVCWGPSKHKIIFLVYSWISGHDTINQTHVILPKKNDIRGPFHKRGSTNSELIYPQFGNSEFPVPEKLMWVSSVNSKYNWFILRYTHAPRL